MSACNFSSSSKKGEDVLLEINRPTREAEAIQRLEDIRTLQLAYKNNYGEFAPTMDALVEFYNTGEVKFHIEVGSVFDSLAIANTIAMEMRA